MGNRLAGSIPVPGTNEIKQLREQRVGLAPRLNLALVQFLDCCGTAMMQDWADYIDALRAGGKVLALRRRAR